MPLDSSDPFGRALGPLWADMVGWRHFRYSRAAVGQAEKSASKRVLMRSLHEHEHTSIVAIRLLAI